MWVTIAVLAVVTHMRVHEWRTDLALWAAEVRTNPHSVRAQLNFGVAKDRAGDKPGAMLSYLNVLALSEDPHQTVGSRIFARISAMTNIAHLEMQEGRFDDAEKLISAVRLEQPSFKQAIYNSAIIAIVQGRCDDAKQEIEHGRAFGYEMEIPAWNCAGAHK